jgi:hypothetical protein
MAVMLDQAQILHASMEKKAKQFDRIVGEWKAKVWQGVHEMDTWNFWNIPAILIYCNAQSPLLKKRKLLDL